MNVIKRIVNGFLCLMIAITSAIAFSGCNSSLPEEQAEIVSEAKKDYGKVLIVYFSVAENSDVDAVSSASVTKDGVGIIKAVADNISTVTGGEMFSIQTSVDYPGNGNDLIEYAKQEQENNERPELTSNIENLESYDTIFVGYPIWWYDLPQVMYSFFDKYDFSEKNIIPFCTHNGSRFTGTIEKIQELEPNANVITNGYTVSEKNVESSADDIYEWLKNIGF
ncbi:MAG: flavodoxin [Lachnospirales bacterium]